MIETLLAEKTQTIISRGTANTRMRDFYDLYEIIQKMKFKTCILVSKWKNFEINLNIKIILLKISNILKCSLVYQRQFYASRDKRLCQQ